MITSNNIYESNQNKPTFDLFPTVTNGPVNIEYSSTLSGTVQVNVYNQAGLLVDKQQLAVAAGLNLKQLNFGKLSNGFYLVQINQNNSRSVQKLVILH
jgi:hypothetical protein